MEINRLRIEIQKPNESRIHSRSALLQHANARAQFWQFKTSSIQQTTNNGEWCVQNTEHISFHVCWLHNRGKTHIKHTLRYSIHTHIHLFIWIFLPCSKDFKNSQSWSICHFACMCVCVCVSWIFIVCEHLAIHFHLNCPLAFGLFARSFVPSFGLLLFQCVRFLYVFFLFSLNEVDVDNGFSMYWCSRCTPRSPHSYSVLFTSLESWFEFVHVKSHTVNTEHLNFNHSL